MKREFCCTECGLIWFDEKMSAREVNCPECNTKDFAIYPCDTMGWFYASEGAKENLKSRGKKIHYAKDHPWYGKEE